MKLQLALDCTDLSEALALLDEAGDLVDIVEIGTPLVLREGAGAIGEIARRYRRLEILADFKIMDAGEVEARIAFDAGADIVTVLGVANDATIVGCVAAARQQDRRIMVDLVAVPDVATRATEVVELGADYICVHTAYDVQKEGVTPLRDVQQVQAVLGSEALAVAGGVTAETVTALLPYDPAIVVVGGYIANHAKPREAAQAIRDRLQ